MVTNVLQHANALNCWVSLLVDKGLLKVQIQDDGDGIPQSSVHGVGMNSMRERTEELGGRFRLDSLTTGICILAEIPIPHSGGQA